MADNLTTQSATPATIPATSVIATDDVAGVHFQKVKIDVGGDGASVILSTSNPLPISDAGGALTVDGTVTANLAAGTNNIGDVDVLTLPAIPAGTNNIGDVDVLSIAAGDNNIGNVDVVTLPAVTNAGTFAVQESGSALTALQLIDDAIYTDDADWTDDTSKHVLVGGAYQSAPHTVTDGDVTPFLTDANGRLVVAATDNGGTLTVDGTVTANLSATDNAVLDDIALDTEAIKTAVEILDNAISGSEMQVDVVAALPAGTNAIGKLAANTGVDIGDVDVTSVVPGAAASNLGKAEDAAHGSGDIGVMMLAVRQDSQLDLAADGDYMPPTIDGDGGLRVSIVAGAGSGGTAAADDADFTAGTTQGTPAQGVYESTPTNVTDGDLGTVGITTGRRLKTSATIDAALPAGTNNIGDVDVLTMPTITVNSHAVTNAGTFVTQENGAALTALQLIDDTVFAEDVAAQAADKGVAILAVRRDADTSLVDTDNDYAQLQVNANGALKVEVFTGETLPVSLASVPSHAVTNAGTFVTQVDGAALTALQLIDNPVLVDDAAYTPATSSVMMAGFEADEGSTDSVDEGDAGAARMTLDRKLIVTVQPHTTGGLTPFRSLDLDETEEEVKSSAGQVYGWFIANLATTTRFVKFYNATAANVTVGTTTPILTLPIPGNSTDDIAANALGALGIIFDTAITVAATTGVLDNDTGAPGANEVVVNIFYK